MLKNNIKYKVVGSFYFYNRKEIKDLLCYLRLINNHKDDVSILRVINTPKRGIGEKTIDSLTSIATNNGVCIYDAISSGKELEFKKLIEYLKEYSENASLTELVDEVLDKSGMKKELSSSKLLEDEIRLENLNEFKSITQSYEEEYGTCGFSQETFMSGYRNPAVLRTCRCQLALHGHRRRCTCGCSKGSYRKGSLKT